MKRNRVRRPPKEIAATRVSHRYGSLCLHTQTADQTWVRSHSEVFQTLWGSAETPDKGRSTAHRHSDNKTPADREKQRFSQFHRSRSITYHHSYDPVLQLGTWQSPVSIVINMASIIFSIQKLWFQFLTYRSSWWRCLFMMRIKRLMEISWGDCESAQLYKKIPLLHEVSLDACFCTSSYKIYSRFMSLRQHNGW